jgi:tripartite-type tricarboxylate transporter receptor subunit TctC
MRIPRRQFLQLAGAALLSAVPSLVWAQSYPTRPVRFVVAFAAGGPNDIIARLLAQWLSVRLGQQFIVENRTGAGGNIGTEAVTKAAPDGYTFLVMGASNAINPSLYAKLSFDPVRDLVPVAGILRNPNVLVLNPVVPAKTVPEFIAYAKANPRKITMASAGIGSNQHLSGEYFKMLAGVDLVHVPYRGGGPALIDLVGGQVQMMIDPILSSIVETLNREINEAFEDPAIKARLAEWGATPLYGSPADYWTFFAQEIDKWAKVVKFSGARAE